MNQGLWCGRGNDHVTILKHVRLLVSLHIPDLVWATSRDQIRHWTQSCPELQSLCLLVWMAGRVAVSALPCPQYYFMGKFTIHCSNVLSCFISHLRCNLRQNSARLPSPCSVLQHVSPTVTSLCFLMIMELLDFSIQTQPSGEWFLCLYGSPHPPSSLSTFSLIQIWSFLPYNFLEAFSQRAVGVL